MSFDKDKIWFLIKIELFFDKEKNLILDKDKFWQRLNLIFDRDKIWYLIKIKFDFWFNYAQLESYWKHIQVAHVIFSICK